MDEYCCPKCGEYFIPKSRRRKSNVQYGLKDIQNAVLKFIAMQMRDNDGVSPSFSEIMDTFSLKSKSEVSRILNGLHERGYIHRLKGKARSIVVVKSS